MSVRMLLTWARKKCDAHVLRGAYSVHFTADTPALRTTPSHKPSSYSQRVKTGRSPTTCHVSLSDQSLPETWKKHKAHSCIRFQTELFDFLFTSCCCRFVDR